MIVYILYNNRKSITPMDLIKMYRISKKSVYVNMIGGLGNRLLSFVGIIIMSIFHKSKPFSI